MTRMDFGFIGAKLHGQRAKMYDRENLPSLLELRSLGDLAMRLRGDLALEDHYALERSVVGTHVETLARYYPMLDDPHSTMFGVLLRRYALENLKIVIRSTAHPEQKRRLPDFLVNLPRSIDVMLEPVMEAADVAEMVKAVPIESWRSALEQALPAFEEKHSFFVLEAALDAAYWRDVEEALKAMGSDDTEFCKPMIGLEADATRLLVTLRCSRNYGLGWTTIQTMLPPRMGALSDATLKDLAERERESEAPLVNVVRRQLHIDYEAHDFSDLNKLEFALWEKIYRLSNSRFYQSFDNFGILIAFFFLKRMELRNLICIIELIRYGALPEDVKSSLIPPLSSSR